MSVQKVFSLLLSILIFSGGRLDMENKGQIILDFIAWLREVHTITLEDWSYGSLPNEVIKEDLNAYVEDFMEGTYEP